MAPSAATPRRRRDSPRKGDLREQAILDAAEELLNGAGIEPMTVEAIATRAGITRGALYFYFGSKQAVLAALIARTLVQLRDTAAAIDLDSSPREAVARLAQVTEQSWREHGTVMRAAVDLSPTVPEIAELWTSAVEQNIQALSAVFTRAGIPNDKSASGAPTLARTLCWMTERNLYWASATGSPTALKRAGQACLNVWFQLLPAD